MEIQNQESRRKQLNSLQKETFALVSDISDLETRLDELRKKATELYENNDRKLDRKEIL